MRPQVHPPEVNDLTRRLVGKYVETREHGCGRIQIRAMGVALPYIKAGRRNDGWSTMLAKRVRKATSQSTNI